MTAGRPCARAQYAVNSFSVGVDRADRCSDAHGRGMPVATSRSRPIFRFEVVDSAATLPTGTGLNCLQKQAALRAWALTRNSTKRAGTGGAFQSTAIEHFSLTESPRSAPQDSCVQEFLRIPEVFVGVQDSLARRRRRSLTRTDVDRGEHHREPLRRQLRRSSAPHRAPPDGARVRLFRGGAPPPRCSWTQGIARAASAPPDAPVRQSHRSSSGTVRAA